MSKKALGKTLRDLRIEKKLTQEFLAEKADIDRTYIYRIEHGLREPTFFIFLDLIEALKVSPDEFVSRLKEEIKVEKKASKRK
jgi:transcriptional regulator with XRE-family HTH domain